MCACVTLLNPTTVKIARRPNARACQEQNAPGGDGSNPARHPEHVNKQQKNTIVMSSLATKTTTTTKTATTTTTVNNINIVAARERH